MSRGDDSKTINASRVRDICEAIRLGVALRETIKMVVGSREAEPDPNLKVGENERRVKGRMRGDYFIPVRRLEPIVGSWSIRKCVLKLVEMFSVCDLDSHATGKPHEFAGARILEYGNSQSWLTAIHCAKVLKNESAASPRSVPLTRSIAT